MLARTWAAAYFGDVGQLFWKLAMALPGRFLERSLSGSPQGTAIMTLELRNVSKRFTGILAVDNVSFQARAGEITGYLGPNGSGKSTTMKMITGLIETTSGEIFFDGRGVRGDLRSEERRVGKEG